MQRTWFRTVAVLCLLAVPIESLAVKPAAWEHKQPSDFLGGDVEDLVVSSLGELTLGRQTQVLEDLEAKAEVVNALARAGDGRIYAATGPEGVIYRIDGDKVTEFAKLPEPGTVLSLLFNREGMLLAGTGGGDQARIYRFDGDGKATVFHEPEEARYVWAMALGSDGRVFAATGVEGRLFAISADGKDARVLADVKVSNLLCLAFGTDGMLYAGTDGEGLVYRINPDSGNLYVMYDAKEPEVSTIVVDAEGNVYAGTASADGAKPGRAVADKPGGHPEESDDDAASKPSSRPGAAGKPAGADTRPAESKPAKPASGKTVGKPATASSAAEGGNAIYRIDTDGFVTEVFRNKVTVLALVEDRGTLYVGTGDEGRIWEVKPAEDRTTMLAKLEAEQAPAMIQLAGGQLVIGTANAASLVRMTTRYAEKGTLTSDPLDAGQIVKFGRITAEVNIPQRTALTVATRSGNVSDKESEAWDDWSDEMDLSAPQQIRSPGARFLQYRITMTSTDGSATATLRSITLPRVEENRPPTIASLEVLSAQEEAKSPSGSPKVKQLVGGSGGGSDDNKSPQIYWVAKWKAEDPNQDTLEYELFFREIGRDRWIRMAKEIKESFAIWDTRTVADGEYEIRLLGNDAASNPPGTELSAARVSDPVTVDNTPPDITITSIDQEGTALVVRAAIRDARSPITDAAYTVDSAEEWKQLAADDDIFDSPSESVTFTLRDLEPGEHRIAIRAGDKQDNTRYVTRWTEGGK